MTGTVLITGGQRGIGLGIAKVLSQADFRLALASRSAPDHPDVAAALESLGPEARYYANDIADIGQRGALLDRIEAEQGPITTLVSNAGVGSRVRGDLLDITPENFDFVMGVNLRGAFFLARDVARRMLAREDVDTYRSIVFVTSISAKMVSINRADYCVSKAAASAAASHFAARLAPAGIGVFEIQPGIIETPMTDGVHADYTPRIEGGLVPASRWGQPSDIAEAILPMVEGRMAFATGAAVPIDGGLSIPRL
ncbi:3-ketoacyl-ACP reductase [Sulfitobacter sp. D35]|uniref:3-ketoacyl-ACP reductase n=1 Tax=Sulfitobacter sp. D35 TaxID=3083252 RepID=UPI00296F51E0|nr:3-ketoacyl-ACP reductase [Sulfitobacter sp. D35]MDW4499940.1 3-ketoacyl-ACP reductase [Sulfitobacter sp. D35]